MGRCTVIRWAFVAGGLFIVGCAGTRSTAPIASLHGSDDAKSSSSADAQNPFKRSDRVASKDDASKSDKDDDASPSADSANGSKSAGKNGGKTASLDLETRRLMLAELKFEPAEDRERLFNQWKQFDPAFIRELIETRRAVRKSKQLADGNRGQAIRLASAEHAHDSSHSDTDDTAWADSTQLQTSPQPPASPRSTATSTPASDAATTIRDAFDSANNAGRPDRPIAIYPRNASPGMARNPAAQTSNAGSEIASPSDGFTAISTDPAPSPQSAPQSATQAAKAGAAKDGLVIEPGTAPPASVISNLQFPSKQGRSAGGNAPETIAAAGTEESLAIATSAAQLANSQGGSEPVQPVRLGSPTDIPGTAVADSFGEGPSPMPKPAKTSGSNNASTQNPPPSGFAGLTGRFLGAITPGQNASARASAAGNNWHDELQKIVAAAASEAAQTSVGTTDAEKLKYVEKQVHLRMLYVLSGKPARSIEPIAGLESADQDFWQQVFWGVSNYFDTSVIADPSDRATQTVMQLRTAVHRLQEKSKLELHNVAFCHKITNYGNYERFKRDEFTAGQPVLLYTEVENFKSEPTADGPYRTNLKSTIEIYDSRGGLVQNMPFPPTEDFCTNPRRDFYNSYEFAIPQRIGLGPHTLKLKVEDQISQKVATYTLNFTVK